MYKSLKIVAAAALFAATAGMANAAPASVGQVGDGIRANDLLQQVEGPRHRRFDRSCRKGPGGWYRYDRHGERRGCREWRGQGRRPDACVKFGPIFYCDY